MRELKEKFDNWVEKRRHSFKLWVEFNKDYFLAYAGMLFLIGYAAYLFLPGIVQNILKLVNIF